MDWYPLWNSLRIALISCAAVFFLGIFAAYYIARLPRVVKGVLDVLLTLPMVLPPTVCGFLLLLVFFAVLLFLHFVPLGLWISALAADVNVGSISILSVFLCFCNSVEGIDNLDILTSEIGFVTVDKAIITVSNRIITDSVAV